MKKNIRRYKYYQFFKNCLWIAPIMTLFYLQNDLSYAEIFILASVFRISQSIFEVPTGAVADKYGYKKSTMIGLIILASSLGIYAFGHSFIYFAMCEVLAALGFALISGADEALFYESLVAEKKEKEYNHLMGRARQYQFLSQIIGSIVAAIFFEIDAKLPFIISAVLIVGGFILFSTFEETAKPKEKSEGFKSYLKHMYISGKYIFNHKKVLIITVFAGLIGMAYSSIHFAYTPYFLEIGIKPIYFGVIYALFNVTALLASRYTKKFADLTKPKTLIALSILLLSSFALMGVIKNPLGIIAILLMQAYRGMNQTIYKKYINKNTESNKRATVLSFFSLFTTLINSAFAVIVGIIIGSNTIFMSFTIIAAILGIIIFIMNFLLDKNLGKHEVLKA